MRASRLHAWLLALSDPAGCRSLPARPLPGEHWARLCTLASRHGVLPALSANTKRAMATEGVARLAADRDAGAVMERVLADVKRRLIAQAALSLAIRGQIREIAAAFRAAGVPAAVLKGADFADHLYPDPSLRLFTDLDLLVSRQYLGDAERILPEFGYVPQQAAMKYDAGYGERSWVRADRQEGTLEVHWNLVNSPTLRRGVSLSWEDLAFEKSEEAEDGLLRPTTPARLLIAAVHGAASHGFDRLQPLYDISLAAQRCAGESDIRWLSETAGRTGAGLPLAVSFSLAWRLFGTPACDALRAALRLPRRGLWTVLLSPGVVLRGHWPPDSFRRQLFREMLKRR